jgi:hypothetical protein
MVSRYMPREPQPINVCPVCSSPIDDVRPVGGIWTGGVNARAANGPMYEAKCKKCGAELTAFPTNEEADAGQFLWERQEIK